MKQLIFKQKVVQGIYDLLYIWKQEFRTTFRDQGVLIFFVLVPSVYPLIYSSIYTNEAIHEVPIAAVDNLCSSLSREYLQKVDASPETSIVAYRVDTEEAKFMLKDRKAHGIIYILTHFSDDIVQGKQIQVSTFCDMSGLPYYKTLLTANTNVSPVVNVAIKMERASNAVVRQDEITVYPIECEDVAIFNPTNGFVVFLVPAVLILITQQTLLSGIGLSVGTTREHNQFKDLVPTNRHYNGTLRIAMGKGLSYFMVYPLVAVYILCVVPRLFSLNQIAIPGVLILFTLSYLIACIFLAMTASIAIRNRETCMLLFVFTSVPLLSLPDISRPGSAMPSFWGYFSYFFPSTSGINGYARISNMGVTLNEVASEYHALRMQIGIYFLTTCFVYRRQIIQSRKNHSPLYPARL